MTREISPLDGRYADRIGHLGEYFSEFALMEARAQVECAYLLAQEETGLWPLLSGDRKAAIQDVMESFDDEDFERIKVIERTTRHDVKSVELFLREALALPDLMVEIDVIAVV